MIVSFQNKGTGTTPWSQTPKQGMSGGKQVRFWQGPCKRAAQRGWSSVRCNTHNRPIQFTLIETCNTTRNQVASFPAVLPQEKKRGQENFEMQHSQVREKKGGGDTKPPAQFENGAFSSYALHALWPFFKQSNRPVFIGRGAVSLRSVCSTVKTDGHRFPVISVTTSARLLAPRRTHNIGSLLCITSLCQSQLFF